LLKTALKIIPRHAVLLVRENLGSVRKVADADVHTLFDLLRSPNPWFGLMGFNQEELRVAERYVKGIHDRAVELVEVAEAAKQREAAGANHNAGARVKPAADSSAPITATRTAVEEGKADRKNPEKQKQDGEEEEEEIGLFDIDGGADQYLNGFESGDDATSGSDNEDDFSESESDEDGVTVEVDNSTIGRGHEASLVSPRSQLGAASSTALGFISPFGIGNRHFGSSLTPQSLFSPIGGPTPARRQPGTAAFSGGQSSPLPPRGLGATVGTMASCSNSGNDDGRSQLPLKSDMLSGFGVHDSSASTSYTQGGGVGRFTAPGYSLNDTSEASITTPRRPRSGGDPQFENATW
jgi:hypothetical protein